ncbi:Ig-like domain-containing protein [Aliivibrio fischeri]|uniref:Ig-like domain-containing protein n=1 Tax=Aliivibrio fischeri TaxID=668 RepID=UPI002E356B63|nr:Ig-like domain-containing protein [Aliivibrio fischeri]MCE7577720.1 Ig-like domain-containing protein [Aliivibrio fischeri]MCE7589743.1 Ig-like domain-containing protein [Aliivibrio fischeri]
MIKLNKITVAITSVMFSGYLYAADASATSNVVTFVPGETKVQNGDMVSFNGDCFVAKNNPGVWESPTADSWFWDVAECSGEPNPGPGPNPGPNPTPDPDLGDIIPFIPGKTQVENGDVVSYENQCFIAQNNPGVWETPSASSWFWTLTECSDEPVNPEPEVTELSILAPTAGQVLTANEAISINAHVDGNLAAKVEFWANNTKLAEKTVNQNNTQYSQTWTPSEEGNATINVFVFDKNNQKIEQKSVSVTVKAEVTEDFVAPVVKFVTPANGSTMNVAESLSISVNATDADNDLATLVVKANNKEICSFDAANTDTFACDWQPTQAGNVTLNAIATDAQDLSSTATVRITVEEDMVEPPVEPPVTPGDLCKDFNVYPDWTRGDHATGGDIMVHDNIAYSAIYWTKTIPGSDDSWALHLNCDGTEPGTAPLLSLPNPMDPVRLEVAGWPNTLVVASPATSAPTTLTIQASNSADLADFDKLTSTFVSIINAAAQAGSASIIINSDVLDKATRDNALSSSSISVKEALTQAMDITGNKIDIDDINALSNDLKGWANAHHLIISTLAPEASYGWSLSIGDFAFDTHSGRQSVWDEASSFSADLLNKLELYKAELATKADFIAFTKSNTTEALSSDQWHNALEYVKQVSDYVKTPVMLNNIPTDQASAYFMGDKSSKPQIRKAAFSNVFAILFDKNTAELTAKIERYQDAKMPLYYVGKTTENGKLTVIDELNNQLANAEDAMNNTAFLYETPQSQWIPSTVYKWADFMEGLNAMHNIGVAGNKFWLLDENVDDATNIKYAKVAIAAFLAQSMQETIRYNACDENNWSEIKYGAPADYPMSASCGQLGQKYADYGVNPISGLDHAYSCPRDDKMEVSALTHAKWYGAPAPVFAAPDAVLEERGLLVNGSVGRWTNNGHCNDVPTAVDTSKQVWERDTCKTYVDQKAGSFIWDGSSQESVQGCGWWGRGVIQTTGRQNFGTLNHYLGRSHVDPETIGKTIDGVVVEAPPENPLYAELDFCSNPGLICSSEENKEIKWIAGLFYWVTSVQAYPDESGQYGNWNYHNELKKYVDGGMKGTEFIDDVSGIVNRGCPDLVCSTGEVHNVKERRANFKLVLEQLGLNPQ